MEELVSGVEEVVIEGTELSPEEGVFSGTEECSEESEEVSEEELSEETSDFSGVIVIEAKLLSEELSETVGSFEQPVLKMSAVKSVNNKILRKIILSPFLRRHT